jgi:hypothetical protein
MCGVPDACMEQRIFANQKSVFFGGCLRLRSDRVKASAECQRTTDVWLMAKIFSTVSD